MCCSLTLPAAIYRLYNKYSKVSAATWTMWEIVLRVQENRWVYSSGTFSPGSLLSVFVCFSHGWKHTPTRLRRANENMRRHSSIVFLCRRTPRGVFFPQGKGHKTGKHSRTDAASRHFVQRRPVLRRDLSSDYGEEASETGRRDERNRTEMERLVRGHVMIIKLKEGWHETDRRTDGCSSGKEQKGKMKWGHGQRVIKRQ